MAGPFRNANLFFQPQQQPNQRDPFEGYPPGYLQRLERDLCLPGYRAHLGLSPLASSAPSTASVFRNPVLNKRRGEIEEMGRILRSVSERNPSVSSVATLNRSLPASSPVGQLPLRAPAWPPGGTAPTDEAEPNHETHPEAPLTDLNDDPMVPDLVNAALERDLSRAVGPSQGEADAIAATADIEGCTRLRAPLTEGAGFELPPVDQTAAAAPTVSRRGRPPKAKGKAKQKQKGLRLREGTAPLSHTVQDPTETREPPSPSLFIAPAGTGGGGQRRVARADPKAKSKPSRFSKPKTRGRTVALAVSAVTGGKSDSDRKVAERSDPTGQPHTNPPTEAPAQSSARQGQTTQPAGTGSDDVLCGHSGPVSFISLQMAARKLRERLKLLALSGVSFDSTAASVRVSAQTASGNVLRFFPCFPEGREAELRSATLARLHPEHQAWANWGLVPLQCVDGAIEDALAFASLVYEKWHDEESCQMSRGFLEEAYRKGGRPVKGKILVRAAG